MFSGLRSWFGTPCPKHPDKNQQIVKSEESPPCPIPAKRARSRGRSPCKLPHITKENTQERPQQKQVRMKTKVEYEGEEDRSVAGSETCSDRSEKSPAKLPPKKKSRPRKRSPSSDGSTSTVGRLSNSTGDDSPERGSFTYDSDDSSIPCKYPPPDQECRPRKARPRKKPILKKPNAGKGRPRSRSQSSTGRSRSAGPSRQGSFNHVHSLDDHDRGSKCRLCTTCAARYQSILLKYTSDR